jgi:hypothetical protein
MNRQGFAWLPVIIIAAIVVFATVGIVVYQLHNHSGSQIAQPTTVNNATATQTASTSTPITTALIPGYRLYKNVTLGIAFEYPSNVTIDGVKHSVNVNESDGAAVFLDIDANIAPDGSGASPGGGSAYPGTIGEIIIQTQASELSRIQTPEPNYPDPVISSGAEAAIETALLRNEESAFANMPPGSPCPANILNQDVIGCKKEDINSNPYLEVYSGRNWDWANTYGKGFAAPDGEKIDVSPFSYTEPGK